MCSRIWILYFADTIIYSWKDLLYNDGTIKKKQSEVSHMDMKLRIMSLMDKMTKHPGDAHIIM